MGNGFELVQRNYNESFTSHHLLYEQYNFLLSTLLCFKSSVNDRFFNKKEKC